MTLTIDSPRTTWDRLGLTRVDPAKRTGHRAHWNGLKVGLTPADDHAKCLAKVRSFWDHHVRTNDWLDLGYNFLICVHGLVIEGRGADFQGSHSKGSNTTEYGTQFMVGEGDEIPDAMFEAFLRLHAELEEHSGHQLEMNVHRDPPDDSGTTCPGDVIEAMVHAMRPAPPAEPNPSRPKLRLGDRGEHVTFLQERLFAKGHNLDRDGVFGPATDNAVRIVQSDAKLTVDGVVGPDTWAVLQAPDPVPAPPEPAPTPPPSPAPAPEPPPPPPAKDEVGQTIRPGDEGKAVTAAQNRLIRHGFPLPVHGADGHFGAETEATVRAFQRARGLLIDGVVGAQTWVQLLEQTEVENFAECRTKLTAMGWRCDTPARLRQAVKDFQGMYNLGPALAVDGKPGPRTMAALRFSHNRHKAGEPNISAHFDADEFACKCAGRYSSCRRIWATRALVQGAERYRTLAGPFTPLSACRCWDHNKAVGGYHRSQHLHGTGMDVTARFSVARVKALRAFPAIGINRSNSTVRHVDFRNLSLDNYPPASGSTSNPYVYFYG